MSTFETDREYFCKRTFARYEWALKQIADPRLRDHVESDLYAERGCMMEIARKALEDDAPSDKTAAK